MGCLASQEFCSACPAATNGGHRGPAILPYAARQAHTCSSSDARLTMDQQEEILEAISDALHEKSLVKRIDTHASTIFLAGKRALKIKRAVKFPFLDYSTLSRRKAACVAELNVNRPLAPQIYKGLVAIVRGTDGSIRIGGEGTPIEWAVEMERFDETATLDKLADHGTIDDKLADEIAQAVVFAHKVAPAANAELWLKALKTFIDQNDAAFRSEPTLFSLSETEVLYSLSIRALEKAKPLILIRGSAGLIKHLHGDLHLGNIVLLDERPVLFDAIEFDPLIAIGDVLYDLAFLIMDLSERGLKLAANIVFNSYLRDSKELSNLDALALLPLFLSLRAAIRAKVCAARSERANTADRPGIKRSALKYFEFAVKCLRPRPAALLAIAGLSGTGKSVLALRLAPNLGPVPGAVVLRSDIERKHLFGVSEFQRLPPECYSIDATKRVYDSLACKAGRVIAAGHSAIVDAVYARAEERDAIENIAAKEHVTFQALFLTADLNIRLARVSERAGDASDANRSVVLQQAQYDLGKLEWPLIDASGSPEQTLTMAEEKLSTISAPCS